MYLAFDINKRMSECQMPSDVIMCLLGTQGLFFVLNDGTSDVVISYTKISKNDQSVTNSVERQRVNIYSGKS